MASTDIILARLGERKTNPTEELQKEVSEHLDVPRCRPQPGSAMRNKVAELLGPTMSQQSTPMD